MQHAILCYHDEAAVDALTKQEDDALMASLAELGDRLVAEGKLGPVARLMPTTAATTLRYGGDPLVVDGPFAETKEALLGFYIVECESLDDAIEVGRRLVGPRMEASLSGAMEIRPVRVFFPDRRSTCATSPGSTWRSRPRVRRWSERCSDTSATSTAPRRHSRRPRSAPSGTGPSTGRRAIRPPG